MGGNTVHAVRLLVKLQEPGEDEETAQPDTTGLGLRVSRKAHCALDVEDTASYTLKVAGTAPTVQWLMTSPGGSCFLVTAQVRCEDNAFTVLAYENASTVGVDMYQLLMKQHIKYKDDVAVTQDTNSTPLKRLALINQAAADPSTPEPFNKRTKFA